MTTAQGPEQPLSHRVAETILEGFNRHFQLFQEITRAARDRFE